MCLTCFSRLTISSPLSFSPLPPSPSLAVEDNVTEDQHSPGQTAIPSGNAPFRILPFLFLLLWIGCTHTRMSVKSLLGFEAWILYSFLFSPLSFFYTFDAQKCTLASVFREIPASAPHCLWLRLCRCACVSDGSFFFLFFNFIQTVYFQTLRMM